MQKVSAPQIRSRPALIKKFARSRSKSNSNPPSSPRASLSNHFAPRFIPNPTKNNSKNMTQSLSLSLGQTALEHLHTQLKIIQLEDELRSSEAQRKKMQAQNQHLKEQIAELQKKQNSISNNYESRSALKQNRFNQNLAKLKRQIAENRQAETRPSIGQLEEQNKFLLAQNNYLRKSLKETQISRSNLSPRPKHQPREQIQQETISQLQNQLKSMTEQNRQLDLHLKVMHSRLANQEKNAESIQNEELSTLKIKYSKLITQHQAVRKELAQRKRKEREQPKILIVEDRSRSVSLSLSSEGR